MSRFALYQAARRLLPVGLRRAIGRTAITRAMRDRFFRPSGRPHLVEGEVEWMDLSFTYTAPIQPLDRAQRNGVENRICRLVRSVLEPGDLALDVGANYGFITLVMAKTVGPTGHLLCFEIEPHIQEAIERTRRANHLEKTITLIPKGAGATSERGLITVDDALKSHSRAPRLIKIDVDGPDLDVLKGARRCLERHHPVVIIEMTQHQQEIYDLLVQAGYFHFIDQSNQPVLPGRWPENLIASIEPVKIPLRS